MFYKNKKWNQLTRELGETVSVAFLGTFVTVVVLVVSGLSSNNNGFSPNWARSLL